LTCKRRFIETCTNNGTWRSVTGNVTVGGERPSLAGILEV
jgi:hypothetical protein